MVIQVIQVLVSQDIPGSLVLVVIRDTLQPQVTQDFLDLVDIQVTQVYQDILVTVEVDYQVIVASQAYLVIQDIHLLVDTVGSLDLLVILDIAD